MNDYTGTGFQESWRVAIESDGAEEKVTVTAYVGLARIIQIQGFYIEDLDKPGFDYKHVFFDPDSEELEEWVRTGADWSTWNQYDYSVSGMHQGRAFHAEVVFYWDEEMRIALRAREAPWGEIMEYWDVDLKPELSEKDGIRCWKLEGESRNPRP